MPGAEKRANGIRRLISYDGLRSSVWGKEISRTITFVVVVVAWVFFRSDNVYAAMGILKGMAGINGMVLPDTWLLYSGGFGRWLSTRGILFGPTPVFPRAILEPLLLIGLVGAVWYFPNTQQIMGKFHSALETYRGNKGRIWKWLQWNPGWKWAVGSALLIVVSIVMIDEVSEFLYYQF